MVDFFRDGMRAVERILPELPLHPPVTYKGTIRSAQHYRELVQNWLALKPNATRASHLVLDLLSMICIAHHEC